MSETDRLPRLLPGRLADWAQVILTDYEVTMISAVYWREVPDWRVPWRQVQDSFLLLPTVGTVEVTLAGGTRLLRAGEVLLLADGVGHSLRIAPGCERLEQFSLHCYLTSAWRSALLANFTTPVLPLRVPEYWFEALRRLVWAMNQPAFGQRLGALVLGQLLVDLALSGAPMKPLHEHLDPRVATALQTIHDQYARELPVTELARQARLSTVQFRKLFHRHVHASPKHYLLQHRLKHAARLLRASARTAKEIAYATGFNSEAYFHRCFRQAYGCTPLDYRATRRQSV